MCDSGAGVPLGDRQVVVEPAVDLDFGDRADAEADRRSAESAAGALQARRRIFDLARVVEARLDAAPGRRRSSPDLR